MKMLCSLRKGCIPEIALATIKALALKSVLWNSFNSPLFPDESYRPFPNWKTYPKWETVPNCVTIPSRENLSLNVLEPILV